MQESSNQIDVSRKSLMSAPTSQNASQSPIKSRVSGGKRKSSQSRTGKLRGNAGGASGINTAHLMNAINNYGNGLIKMQSGSTSLASQILAVSRPQTQ
jgi:hypothetical protein